MTLVFVVSMVVAAYGGRHSASSYKWKHWAALVVPIVLLARITTFFGAPRDPRDGPLEIVGGLLDLTAMMLILILSLTWMAGMRVLRNIEILHPQRSEIPPSKRSPQYYEWLNDRGRYVDRSAAIGELTSLAATAGGLLVGLTAFNVAVGSETQQGGRGADVADHHGDVLRERAAAAELREPGAADVAVVAGAGGAGAGADGHLDSLGPGSGGGGAGGGHADSGGRHGPVCRNWSAHPGWECSGWRGSCWPSACSA